jgi:hypothetical protein
MTTFTTKTRQAAGNRKITQAPSEPCSGLRKRFEKNAEVSSRFFESAVREVEAGRFQIDAFKTSRNGKRERVS